MNSPPFRLACLLVFILFLLLFASSVHASTERRVALVIGNGAYRFDPLRNPVNDATDMAAALRGLGFAVTALTDAGHKAMEDAVYAFGRELGRGGVGLFYFAGHGVQVNGRNYLIPVDARVESEADVRHKALDAGWVLSKMEDAGNSMNIVILDSCRNNPFARSFRSATPGLAQMDAPTGSIIAFATAPGGVAADGTGRNGVFTKHLMDNLAKPGLTITDVLMHTRIAVARETGQQQIPWESSSLMSLFYFTPPATAGASATQPSVQPPIAPPVSPPQTTQPPATQQPQQVAMGSRPSTPTGPKAGDVWKEPHTGMEFVWVPGGCYMMGCGDWTHSCLDREYPVHEVCLDGFWMGRYEVTQAQWEKVMGSNPSKFKEPNNPVERVSWNDAQNYIRALNSRSSTTGFRLPTEAEWEYACRSGGKEELYCGGNNVDSVAWYKENYGTKIHPVGGKSPNALGIYDMSGNVWEWVSDVWDEKAYSRSGRRNNPEVTGGGSDRVVRGGSGDGAPRHVRSGHRGRVSPDDRFITLGFRLAKMP